MAKRLTYNCATGQEEEVEMSGDELAAYEALRAAPEAGIAPTRDDRLLAAVDAAKTAVAGGKVFSAEQAAVLSAVFDGLGRAITGEAP